MAKSSVSKLRYVPSPAQQKGGRAGHIARFVLDNICSTRSLKPQRMAAMGVNAFVALGPGQVGSGLESVRTAASHGHEGVAMAIPVA